MMRVRWVLYADSSVDAAVFLQSGRIHSDDPRCSKKLADGGTRHRVK